MIFESGLANDMQVWENIPDSIAKDTKVFLCDRAGIGLSDTNSRDRTIPMIEELKILL